MPLDQGQYLEDNPTIYTPDYMSKTRTVTSRLAKKEQKKMAKQTVYFMVAAIVLLVLFLFFIIPGAVRLAGNIVGNNLGTEPQDTIPPVAPTISAPPAATAEQQIEIAGFSEPESEVVLVLNQAEYARESADAEGAFTFTVPLEEGENTLAFYALDAAKNESMTSRTYTLISDRTDPELSIEQPAENAQIQSRDNQMLQIIGTTEEKAKVYLNDRLLFVKSDGSFSGNYQLQEGENKLMFKSVDQAGNTTEKEITVTFTL